MGGSGTREAVRVASPEALSLADVARQYAEHGRAEEARILLDGLIVLEPEVAYLHTALGCVLMQLKKDDEALERFAAALSLDPRDAAAHTYAGELRLSRGEVQVAAAHLDAAISLDPEGKDPYANRARMLRRAHESKEAPPAGGAARG
ncbi:MAG: hypothetical protein A2V74_05995 [Acidobacteria bacterium RBG_16_70_10]|nr:MAG: hypothetical protein A2V74_05995 [Acidobacteria bacterium RBG_16_70_10]